MQHVVFLRGVNVGGYRRFRPSLLAKELGAYNVVSVGAAGTFVVRKPVSRRKLQAELLRRLPFEAEIMICDGRDFLELEKNDPFRGQAVTSGMVRFVTILSAAARVPVAIPFQLPADGQWLVRLTGVKDRFVFGVYRRHMKTIGYLGKIDKLFGAQATTRNWNTILAIVRILKS